MTLSLCLRTLAIALWLKNYFCGGIQVTCIALVGINMHFQFCTGVSSNQYIVKRDAALRAGYFQCHYLSILHPVIIGLFKIHVDVSRGANDALFELDGTGGATKTQPGVPAISPECRTGASIPNEIASVRANST